jgi:hypothetical protein
VDNIKIDITETGRDDWIHLAQDVVKPVMKLQVPDKGAGDFLSSCTNVSSSESVESSVFALLEQAVILRTQYCARHSFLEPLLYCTVRTARC